MPLSDSQVKAEQAGPRRRNVSVGDSLFLVIESASRGGGKSFEGRMRFPSGRRSGNSSANTYGNSFYVDYSRNYNPSKRTRFKGVWDSRGNYADLD